MAYKSLEDIRNGFWEWLEGTPEGNAIALSTMGELNTSTTAWHQGWVGELEDEGSDGREEAFTYLVGEETLDACQNVGYNPSGDSFTALTYYLRHIWATEMKYNEE